MQNAREASPQQMPAAHEEGRAQPSPSLQLLEAAAQQAAARVVRVRGEPAYVLSVWPWRETSVIAELLTEHHGRAAVTVKGAKRPGGKFRGLINLFNPLVVNYSGAGEVKNLTDARWLGGLALIPPEAMTSAFYATELVLRMTVREDPCPGLFAAYTELLASLAHEKGLALEAALRRFEVRLLAALGWAQAGGYEQTPSEGGDAARLWTVRSGALTEVKALLPGEEPVPEAVVRAIARAEFTDAAVIRRSRAVLRAIIGYYVGERGLNTRATIALWAGI